MEFVHGPTLEAVQGWLRVGQDVLLRGDVGAGRTTVLRELFEQLRAAGTHGVVLGGSAAASDVPLAAFQTNLRLDAAAGRWDLREATRALADALGDVGDPVGVVLLDDVHLLDRVSLAAVSAVVRSPGRRIRVVAAAPDGVDLAVGARELVRSAALVTIDPLEVGAVAALLADVLGGPVGIALATTVAGRSGGNPRVATAFVAAALHAGRVARVDGRWAQVGAIDTVPTDAVVHGLVGDLSPELRRGLDELAWLGLADVAQARRFVGPDVLDALVAHGRVAMQERDRTPMLAVSPPALAQALRLRLAPARRDQLHDRLDEADARSRRAAGRPPAPWAGERRPSLGDRIQGASSDEAAQIITILLESVRTQAALWEQAWLARPSVADALPLARLRLIDDVVAIDADEVFERTVRDEADHPEEVASFVLLRGQWAAQTGRDLRDALLRDPGPSGGLVLEGAGDAFLDTLHAVYVDGEPPTRVGGFDPDADVPRDLGSLGQLLLAHAEIESGAPDAALEREAAWTSSQRQYPLADQLDAAREDALLLVGQVDDALAWARGRLSACLDALDVFGVRLAVRGLATAHLLRGDEELALRTAEVALRLGRLGPVHAAYEERVVGIAAALHARRGEHEVAAALLDDLRRLPRPYVPSLDVMRPWTEMEVAWARAGGAASGAERGAASGATGGAAGGAVGVGERLWVDGEERLGGTPTSAAICWALTPLVLTPDRLARLDALVESIHAPALRPLVHLHHAMTRGTSADVVAALHGWRSGGPVCDVAVGVARERGAREGRADEVEAELATLGGPTRPRPVGPGAAAGLTAREAEIVALARDGLGNREIASRLYVSVRTVESHLYRAMQKLGVTNRKALRDTQE